MREHGRYNNSNQFPGRHHHGGHGRNNRWLSELKGRRRPKIEKGEIRFILLDALKDKQMHGYEIMQSIGEKTGGVYKPSPGSVYPALQMMEDMGLITYEESDNKKSYSLTESGRAELASQREFLDELYSEMLVDSAPAVDAFLEEEHRKVEHMFRFIYTSFRNGKLNIEDDESNRKIQSAVDTMTEQVKEIINNS